MSIYPAFKGHCELVFDNTDPEILAANADLVFTALPHQAAMDIVPELLDRGVKVIDLSADYRLKDPQGLCGMVSVAQDPRTARGGCLWLA